MPLKTFIRLQSWYQAESKSMGDDLEITSIVSNAVPAEPVVIASEGGGGSTPAYVSSTLASYASNALAVAAIGVGKLYKSTTLINDSPIILITI